MDRAEVLPRRPDPQLEHEIASLDLESTSRAVGLDVGWVRGRLVRHRVGRRGLLVVVLKNEEAGRVLFGNDSGHSSDEVDLIVRPKRKMSA